MLILLLWEVLRMYAFCFHPSLNSETFKWWVEGWKSITTLPAILIQQSEYIKYKWLHDTETFVLHRKSQAFWAFLEALEGHDAFPWLFSYSYFPMLSNCTTVIKGIRSPWLQPQPTTAPTVISFPPSGVKNFLQHKSLLSPLKEMTQTHLHMYFSGVQAACSACE